VTQNQQAKKVISASRLLLAAVWIVAFSSIPSARDYQHQLDDGVAPKDIATLFSTLLILVTITSIVAWFAIVTWMRERYDQHVAHGAGQMRLSRSWITWSWLLPIVSFWYPKRMIDDLLRASTPIQPANSDKDPIRTQTWWATWVTYTLMTNLGTLQMVLLPKNTVPFQPNTQIAAACILTASYTVWERIVRQIG
jgi:Domain of unknown function (DUF4328)